MCSIFGGTIEDKHILRLLGIAGSVRGTDATGVATLGDDNFSVYKNNTSADKFNWDNVKEGNFYMGHTRFKTQGTEKNNSNNHPFRSNDGSFVLAHNGIIFNDIEIRKQWEIPSDNIKTDSYVVVQLLQTMKYLMEENELTINIIKTVAETIEGNFTITILDKNRNSFFIFRKGNPFHFLFDGGSLVYASTKDMLEHATKFSDLESFCAPISSIEESYIYEFDLNSRSFVQKEYFKNENMPATYYSWGDDVDKDQEEGEIEEEEIDNQYYNDIKKLLNETELTQEKIFEMIDNGERGLYGICPNCGALYSEDNWLMETHNDEFIPKNEHKNFRYVIENEYFNSEYYKCPSCEQVSAIDTSFMCLLELDNQEEEVVNSGME